MATFESISNVYTASIRNLTHLIDTKVDKTLRINGHQLTSDINIRINDIVGLEQVANTSDMSKPVSVPQQAALDEKAPLTTRVNGHALHENNIIINNNEIPGVENVDNTSDADKPVSIAQQTALDLKVDKTVTINTYPLSSDIILDKNDIGIPNVDNTSDADKPISNAQQAALSLLDSTIASLGTSLNTFTGLLATAVPVGVVMLLFSNTIPNKYLICDGATLLITDYPELFNILGSTYNAVATNASTHFNLPDLRGEFVRGLDRGRGIDATRTLGIQWQSGSTARPTTLPFTTNSQGLHTHSMSNSGGHTHSMTFKLAVQDGSATACYSTQQYNGTTDQSTNWAGDHTHSLNSSGLHTHTITTGGDTETRPRNMAANYIIKASTY